MADIFISYSTKDKAVAEQLVAQIESNGYTCWIAPRNIVPGADWAKSINTAITEAKVFIVIYSRNSTESTQVPKEIGIADARKLPIIPYKIDSTPLSGDFEYHLLSCHWVDAYPQRGIYKTDDVLDAIKEAILRLENGNSAEITAKNRYSENSHRTIGKSGKIILGAVIALLLASIILIVILLTGNNNTPDDNPTGTTTSASTTTTPHNSKSETTTEAPTEEKLELYEAQLIYNQMVRSLVDTTVKGAYTEFAELFDKTYTSTEVTELYDAIDYGRSIGEYETTMFEYSNDTIFGVYSFRRNMVEDEIPVFMCSDFIYKANIIVKSEGTWKFSKISDDHPLKEKIDSHIYPYGPETDDCHSTPTYQTIVDKVDADHYMAKIVNVKKTEDNRLKVLIAIIGGGYEAPDGMQLEAAIYDYENNTLFSVVEEKLNLTVYPNEIKYIEFVSDPLENPDNVVLSDTYSIINIFPY